MISNFSHMLSLLTFVGNRDKSDKRCHTSWSHILSVTFPLINCVISMTSGPIVPMVFYFKKVTLITRLPMATNNWHNDKQLFPLLLAGRKDSQKDMHSQATWTSYIDVTVRKKTLSPFILFCPRATKQAGRPLGRKQMKDICQDGRSAPLGCHRATSQSLCLPWCLTTVLLSDRKALMQPGISCNSDLQ